MIRKISLIFVLSFSIAFTEQEKINASIDGNNVTPYKTITEDSTLLENKNEEDTLCVVSDSLIIEFEKESTIIVEQEKRTPKKDKDFLTLLSYNESRHNWKIMNDYGYIGKYQMGKSCLMSIGIDENRVDYIFKHFKTNPQVFNEDMQDMAAKKWVRLLRSSLKNEIFYYSDKNINGIWVTESGILAAAHLAGVGGVKKYFETGGKYNPSDAFGTSIELYMKKFSNVEVKV